MTTQKLVGKLLGLVRLMGQLGERKTMDGKEWTLTISPFTGGLGITGAVPKNANSVMKLVALSMSGLMLAVSTEGIYQITGNCVCRITEGRTTLEDGN